MSTVEQLEQHLVRAKERLASLEARCGKASQKAANATPGGTSGYDPGILSGIRRKPDHKKDARRFASYDREAAAYRELTACQRDVDVLEARISHAKRNAPVPFTMDQLKPGGIIRTSVGLYRVLKVNTKTVRVEPADAFDFNSFRIDQILEVLK